MNDPAPPSMPPGAPHTGAPFGAGFFAWLRGLGIVRGDDRWFAGVAGGIAARARIDPIIVRGIFVVLAVLGGPGLVLYLVGWFLLPDASGRIHLEEVFRGRAGTAAVVATVAVGIFVVLPLLMRVFGLTAVGGWTLWNALGMPDWLSTLVSIMVWVAVIAAAIWGASHLVVNQRKKAGTAPSGAAAPAASAAPSAAAATAPYATPAAAPAPAAGPAPAAAPTGPVRDAWQGPHDTVPLTDPSTLPFGVADGSSGAGWRAPGWAADLGRDGDAWDAHYAAQHERLRLGPAHVVITLALALLAGGGAGLTALEAGAGGSSVLTAALLGATVVLALSLIIAGVRGRKGGWVGTLAACGVVALLFTSVFPAGTRVHPFGTMAVSTEDPGNVLIAGTSTIDLAPIDTARGAESITVWQLFGTSEIILPEHSPVVVKIRVLAGRIDTTQSARSASNVAGPLLARTIDTRTNTSVPAPEVTVYLLAGGVEVADPATTSLPHGSDRTVTLRTVALRTELA